jgi:hypothetical protein
MVKKHYSDYVRHALRFYTRNLDKPIFHNIISQQNWLVCNSVINRHFPEHKEVIIAVYQPFDTMGDNVYQTSKKYNIPQDNIWVMMADLEKLIAQERGLI